MDAVSDRPSTRCARSYPCHAVERRLYRGLELIQRHPRKRLVRSDRRPCVYDLLQFFGHIFGTMCCCHAYSPPSCACQLSRNILEKFSEPTTNHHQLTHRKTANNACPAHSQTQADHIQWYASALTVYRPLWCARDI